MNMIIGYIGLWAKFKHWNEQMIGLDLTNNLKAEASEISCRHNDKNLGLYIDLA